MDKKRFLDPFARRNNIPKVDPLPDLPPVQDSAEEFNAEEIKAEESKPDPVATEPGKELEAPKKPQFAPGINNNTSLGMKAALAIAFGEKQAEVEGTIIERQPFPSKIMLEKPTKPAASPMEEELGLTKEQMLKLKEIFGGSTPRPAPESKNPTVHPALHFRPGAAGNLDQLSNDFLSKPAIRAWEDE